MMREPKVYLIGMTEVQPGLRQYLVETQREWGSVHLEEQTADPVAVRELEKTGHPHPAWVLDFPADSIPEFYGRVCYGPGTELLTREGWVAIEDLKPGVPVGTVRIEGDMEYQVPTDYIKRPHEGRMYQVESRRNSLFVTPDHDLFVSKGWASSWGYEKAEELVGTTYKLRHVCPYRGSPPQPLLLEGLRYEQPHPRYGDKGHFAKRKVPDLRISISQLPHWATLLGYYISEGTLNMNRGRKTAPTVSVYQREESAQPIFEAVEGCGWAYKRYQDPRNGVLGIKVGGSTLARHLAQFGEGSESKRIPPYAFEWPSELRSRLLDALMEGDGHISKKGVRVYSTVSEGLADDVQRLIFSLGRGASMGKTGLPTGMIYRIRELKTQESRVNHHRRHDSWVDYAGPVYCVSVPNRLLVTRRDKKITLCGNCYDSFGGPGAVGKPGRKSNEEYLDHVKAVKHGSLFEHVVFNFLVVGASRGFTHELVRHRAGWAYSQSSTRFCDGEKLNVVLPHLLDVLHNMARSPEEQQEVETATMQFIGTYEEHRESYSECFAVIHDLTKRILGPLYKGKGDKTALRKLVRSCVRSLLPIGTEAPIGFSCNTRAFHHGCWMRAAEPAELEIRKVFVQAFDLVAPRAPNYVSGWEKATLRDGTTALQSKYGKI